ncbi:hypothetical protein [Archangium sp. Cb G35]|uniref:hypothetical protein n=1 Tax=Archangium sp. Cb G35 TaxID=1920190 RepID=UPI00116108A9|nr:hypothetical protein [Archangium sp. Cb G35]
MGLLGVLAGATIAVLSGQPSQRCRERVLRWADTCLGEAHLAQMEGFSVEAIGARSHQTPEAVLQKISGECIFARMGQDTAPRPHFSSSVQQCGERWVACVWETGREESALGFLCDSDAVVGVWHLEETGAEPPGSAKATTSFSRMACERCDWPGTER